MLVLNYIYHVLFHIPGAYNWKFVCTMVCGLVASVMSESLWPQLTCSAHHRSLLTLPVGMLGVVATFQWYYGSSSKIKPG